ncbi:hypothetical protein V6N12_060296 [Hibiscus sabdariffa]|uniref:Uncharacterized protein n=1 Tax=Hibiscus sabdariffa TaxID=183260 RepID=A0ABR2D413_9ROSI
MYANVIRCGKRSDDTSLSNSTGSEDQCGLKTLKPDSAGTRETLKLKSHAGMAMSFVKETWVSVAMLQTIVVASLA